MFKWLLVFLLCFAFSYASAQRKLKGRVFENKTHIGLAGVFVSNLNNKQTMLTDKNGRFTIPAKTGDLIAFRSFGYHNDTLLVVDLLDKEFYMEPQVIALNQVNIVNTIAPKINTYYDPEFHGQPVVMHRDKEGRQDGGIILRVWYWKKDEHKKAKLEKQQQLFAVMDRITQVFTPQIIGKYVPLTGEEMDDFIQLYTPSPKVFMRSNFDLLNYLNDSYKKYQALPLNKRKPEQLQLN